MRLSSKLQIRMITLTFNLIYLKTMKNSFINSTKYSKNNWEINKFNLRMQCRTKLMVHLELKDSSKHKTTLKIKNHYHSNSFPNSIVTICTSWKSSYKICKWKWVSLKTKNIVWVKKNFKWKTKPKRSSITTKQSFIRLHLLKRLKLVKMEWLLHLYQLLEESIHKRIPSAFMINNNNSSTIQLIQISQMLKALCNPKQTKATLEKFILCTRSSFSPILSKKLKKLRPI